MKHIGILQCGALPQDIQGPFGDIPDMVILALQKIDPTLKFSIYDCINEPLPELDACDAYLCTGSTSSSYEKTPWMLNLEDFIRDGAQKGKKLLGICFGHQLITQALGGKVAPCERGWALGTGFYELTTHKSWMHPPLGKLDILVMHRDQVASIPERSEVIAHSQFCPYFMVQHGPNVLTIQGHPEFTPGIVRHLTDSNIDNFTSNKIREALTSLAAPIDADAVLQWMINFIMSETPVRNAHHLEHAS